MYFGVYEVSFKIKGLNDDIDFDAHRARAEVEYSAYRGKYFTSLWPTHKNTCLVIVDQQQPKQKLG